MRTEENSSAARPPDRSVCSVNGHDHDDDHGGHQGNGPEPGTALAQVREALRRREGGPAFRAMVCLQAAGCTGSQAKALRDRFGDAEVLAAARYAARREPANIGGYVRQCLREGWHRAATAAATD